VSTKTKTFETKDKAEAGLERKAAPSSHTALSSPGVITPYFQTRSGEPAGTHFVEKAKEVGFKQVFPFREKFFAKDSGTERNLVDLVSFVDVSERHKVGREIHIFQK
jgi:hypothetical protein